MDNSRETILSSIGLTVSDFQLESQNDSGYYSIRFQTPEIAIVEIAGGIDIPDIDAINVFLTEFNYQSSIRNPFHRTYVICELIHIGRSVFNRQIRIIGYLLYLQTIVYKSNRVGVLTFFRTKQEPEVFHSKTMDEALLYVFTKKEQNSIINESDYYTNFISIWTSHYLRNFYKNTNLKVVQQKSWGITVDSPYCYATLAVAEGNIFIINMLGFLSNLAVDRLIFLIAQICKDINLVVPQQKIILVIEASEISAISYSKLQVLLSHIKRSDMLERVIVVPSGVIRSFYYFSNVINQQIFKNWDICRNMSEAIDKAIKLQYETNLGISLDQKTELSKLIPVNWDKGVFEALFGALKPLLSSSSVLKSTSTISNPQDFKEMVHNIVCNLKQNIEERYDIEPILIPPQTELELIMDGLDQAVLYCSKTQILWANQEAYSLWGYKKLSIVNQPLSVIIDLSELSGILSRTDNEFDFVNLLTYHFEGHKIIINGKKVKSTDMQDCNTYYLIFKNPDVF
ncbi:MAG: hypothetical protein RBR35_15745 [Salinivirgaceae bacterium]|nr:hypothetical protein [Salinivirgaceae bacterium]MDY0282004.1 hypothetical protein [Salinivirgaceae bacterium]